MGQVGRSRYIVAVKCDDDIARRQPRLVGRPVFRHLHHQRTPRAVEPKGFSEILVHILNGHAQPAPGHPALRFQLVNDIAHDTDRNRKRQADGAAAAREYLRVHPDHLAVEVEQGPAGVAGVDGHIRLDEGHVIFIVLGWQAAPLGADDAGGDRVVQTKGRTDGQHPLPHFQVIVAGEGEKG